MAQCLHIDEGGRRCRHQAEGESDFCLWHRPDSGVDPPLVPPGLRRWAFRLAALLLLGLFLLPLLLRAYQIVRALIR